MIDIHQINKHRPYIILWSCIVAAFCACFFPTFQWMNYKYLLPESYYSHGYIIPVVTLYLIYSKKEELQGATLSSSNIGLVLIIIALLIHILGTIGDINFISGFSIFIYVWGCSLYLLGKQITKKIASPLFFLIFMFPVPDGVLTTIALPMKSLATMFALNILDLVSIPYIQDGFSVHLSTATYVVGTPCNGIRSLISFLALGFLVIHFLRLSLRKSILVLCVIPPMAIVLNGVRIALLLMIANRYGQEAASPESFLHDMSGMVVFIIGLVLLFSVSRIIYGKKEN